MSDNEKRGLSRRGLLGGAAAAVLTAAAGGGTWLATQPDSFSLDEYAAKGLTILDEEHQEIVKNFLKGGEAERGRIIRTCDRSFNVNRVNVLGSIYVEALNIGDEQAKQAAEYLLENSKSVRKMRFTYSIGREESSKSVKQLTSEGFSADGNSDGFIVTPRKDWVVNLDTVMAASREKN